jgi:hypothetical protein
MEALEWSNVMTSATVLPYRANSATYIEEGIEIVSDGEAIIQKTDQDFIYLNFVGGNVDLSKAIGDVIVGDLYADDLTHTWNLTNVYNSRLNNEYYIYPFVDWRTDIDTFYTTPTVDIRQMIPTATAKGFFDRLQSHTGYSFVGAYLDSDVHKNMIISPNELSILDENLSETSAEVIDYALSTTFIIPALEGSGYVQQNFPLTLAIDGPGFFQGSYYPVVNEVGRLRFKGTLAARELYINGGLGFLETPETREYWFVVQIKRDGTVIAEYTETHQIGQIYDLDSFREFNIDLQTPEQILLSGSQYFVNIIFNVEKHSNADVQVDFGFTPDRYAKFTRFESPGIVSGSDINFRDLFRMKAKDVLKDILNLRGIIIQTNSYTKEVQFNYLQDLKNNIPIAKDWSDKIDTRSHTLFFKFGKYAQRNNLIFKERDDVPDGLGDYYFNVDDQTLEAETDVVKLKHPATVEQSRYLGGNIPMIEAIDSLSKWNKPDWRILQLRTETSSFDVTWTDGTSNLVASDKIPFARFVPFNDLVPNFYNVLTEILDRTKALLLPVKLTAIDIQELDHVIPIYLDVPELDINGYFYINKISNYKQGFVPVEFVRL